MTQGSILTNVFVMNMINTIFIFPHLVDLDDY